MRLRIFLAAMLFFSFSFTVFAQEQTENAETEANKVKTIRLFDVFPPLGECELGARIQNLFIELAENPNSKGYIIVYRGSESLPVSRSEAALESQIKWITKQMMFLKLDSSRVEMVDGGFRKTDSIWN